MMKNHRLSNIAGAVVIALGLSASAMADDTSSAIRGSILNPAGESSVNAKVEIVHLPSGRVTTTTTNDSGAFSSRGLRVGGPYKVTVTGTDGANTFNDVYLTLGDTFKLNVQLDPKEEIERISVTGSRILQGNIGSNSYFGSEDITNSPSFDSL